MTIIPFERDGVLCENCCVAYATWECIDASPEGTIVDCQYLCEDCAIPLIEDYGL